MKKSVIIIGRDKTVRRNLIKTISADKNLSIVAQEEYVADSLSAIRHSAPGLIFLYSELPIQQVSQLFRSILAVSATSQPIFVSPYLNTPQVDVLTGAGVRGFLLKTSSKLELKQALKEIINGNIFVSASIR